MQPVVKIQSSGGWVTFEQHGPRWLRKWFPQQNPFRRVDIVSLSPDSTDDDLVQCVQFKDLQQLLLNGSQVKGPGLKCLRQLPRLHTIDLTKSSINDDGLKYVEEIDTIETLLLGRTGVTDAGLRNIQHLTRLKELNLDGTKVTDDSLPILIKFPLKELNLRGTSVAPHGISQLKEAKPALEITK